MRMTIELDLPVMRGDMPNSPAVEINAYDAEINKGELNHYQEGKEFADFCWNFTNARFVDGFLARHKELSK